MRYFCSFPVLTKASSAMASPVLLSLVGLSLSGCAASSLRDAPLSPSQPWTPAINAQGMILPPGSNEATSAGKNHALKLPPGYVLPSDQSLPQHALDRTGSAKNGEQAAPLIDTAHPYNLAELIDIAQSTNPSTRIAWNAARDAALTTGLAKSSYLPRLTATVLGGYNHSQRYGSDSPTVRSNNTGETQALTLNWLLFDFGKRSALIRSAQENSLASNILFTGVHQKLIYGVATAYYLYTATQARVHLVEQSLLNTQEIEQAARAHLHQAQGTVIDVAQAEAATAEARLQLVQIQGDLQNRYLTLLTAMGISPSTKITLQAEAQHPLDMEDVTLSEQMVHNAVAQRPDVLAAYAAERASQSQIKAARAEFLPKIFLSSNISYGTGQLGITGLPSVGGDTSSVNVGSNRLSSIVLGGIRVPVFDGGTRQAQLKMAQNNADTAKAFLQQTEDNSVRQIISAQNSLHTSIMAYQAAQKLYAASKTGFDAAMTAYKSGEGSLTRVLELQNALFKAMMARSDSYHASQVAAASLAFAMGKLGDSTALPGRLPSTLSNIPQPNMLPHNSSLDYPPTPPSPDFSTIP